MVAKMDSLALDKGVPYVKGWDHAGIVLVPGCNDGIASLAVHHLPRRSMVDPWRRNRSHMAFRASFRVPLDSLCIGLGNAGCTQRIVYLICKISLTHKRRTLS